MVKCSKNTALSDRHGIHVIAFLYPVILLGTLFAPFVIHAENPSEITRYTVQRDKTSEFLSHTLLSGTLPAIEIREQSGVYHIKAVVLIAAPADYVRYVLMDYRHIYRLNPSIIESEVLEYHDDGSVSVRTKVVGCATYFCEELDRVQRVRKLPSGDLHAEIVPELSQFRSGQTHWRIKQLDDYCEVTYVSDMEPDIYIPPVVGKFLIKKSIREEMYTSFSNLEKISRILAGRKWLNDNQVANEERSEPACDDCPDNTRTVSE